jgi:hypothetical protein
VDVRLVEYEGVDHWYSEDMLRDMIIFLREHLIKGEDDGTLKSVWRNGIAKVNHTGPLLAEA